MTIQKLFGDAAKVNETLAEEDINIRLKFHCRRYQGLLKDNYQQSRKQDKKHCRMFVHIGYGFQSGQD
jgi:hypothetical protein